MPLAFIAKKPPLMSDLKQALSYSVQLLAVSKVSSPLGRPSTTAGSPVMGVGVGGRLVEVGVAVAGKGVSVGGSAVGLGRAGHRRFLGWSRRAAGSQGEHEI